jgi:hypothetical protein
MKIIKILFVLVFITLFLTTTSSYAAVGDVTGSISSNTVGDFNLSGVNFDPVTGVTSGYANSTLLGKLTFNSAEVVSNNDCPGGGSSCGPSVTWNSDGSGSMNGYIRACAVFVTGCSGTLKPSYMTGGWDGFIRLWDGSSTTWGVKILKPASPSSTTRAVSGNAWGSDVVGWATFSGTMSAPALGVLTVSASTTTPGIISPASSGSLSSATTGGVAPITFAWTNPTKPSGSAPVFSSATAQNPSVSNMTVAGTYGFTVTARDVNGQTATDSVNIVVCSAGSTWNGTSCSAASPIAVTLSASPAGGNSPLSSTLTWTTTGTPTSCTASGDWSGSKTASGGSQAISSITTSQSYTITCSKTGATDAVATATITICPTGSTWSGTACGSVNDLVVNAGPNQTITYPTQTSTTLAGTATSSNTISGSGVSWTTTDKPSGASNPVISYSGSTKSAKLSPTITGLTTFGSYSFQLTVTDSAGFIDTDEMIVHVDCPSGQSFDGFGGCIANQFPVVNVSPFVLYLDTLDPVTVLGTASDADGFIKTMSWYLGYYTQNGNQFAFANNVNINPSSSIENKSSVANLYTISNLEFNSYYSPNLQAYDNYNERGFKSLEIYVCQPGQKWSNTSNKCVTNNIVCPSGQLFDPSKNSCVVTCTAPLIISSDGTYCTSPKVACLPPKTLSADGLSCLSPVVCSAPKVISADGLSCVDCPTGKISKDGLTCVDKPKPGVIEF